MFGLLAGIGNKVWGWIAGIGAVLATVAGIFFFGRSTGKDSERRDQLEAQEEAQKKARETGHAAMKATADSQTKASAETARAEEEAAAKREEAKTSGKTSGGTWGILLLIGLSLTMTACGSKHVEVQFPMIPALQILERPHLEKWTINESEVGSECYAATEAARMAIVTNESRLKGTIKAYEAIIYEYQKFRQEYLHQADYTDVLIPTPKVPGSPVTHGAGGPYVKTKEVK